MTQKKNTLVYIGLSLVALTGGYFIYKYFTGKAALNEGVKQEVPPQDPSVSVDTSMFPLKKGSKNSYVGQLQSALNVAVDNIFGKDTLAALTAQTGKTQIFSNEDLLTTIDSIKNKVDGKQVARNAAATQILTSKYDYTNLHTTKSTSWKQLDLDNNNNYVPTIYIINWGADKNISLSDYEPYDILPDGNLVIYCNKGGNKGYYKADPLSLYLV